MISCLQEKAPSSQGNKEENSAKELAAEGAKVSETLKHTRENYDKGLTFVMHAKKYFTYLNLSIIFF